MSNDEPPIQPEQPPDALRVWPGHRLREAREALGRSQMEVARDLHLDIAIIEALENDNPEALPGQTYLYGYLRSYARLVKLSPDALIDAFQGEVRPTDELLPCNLQYRRSLPVDKIVRYGLIIVVLLVLGGLSVWLLGQDALLSRIDALLSPANPAP
jgi:cytoskeleton protein RodZ